MRLYVILLLILSFLPLQGRDAAIHLSNELEKAQVGDYLVTYHGRTYTLFLVRAKLRDRLVFEEIAVPQMAAPKSNWAEWICDFAPGHTSWVAYALDLKGNRIDKFYSYSRRGYLNLGETDQFLTTLLRLPFEAQPVNERRRIGPPPVSARTDKRPFWNPYLICDGKRCVDVAFEPYRAFWPKDGSELAGREVIIYLPDREGPYPCHFPYWIEVDTLIGDNKVRVVDSGRYLQSPQPEIPALFGDSSTSG